MNDVVETVNSASYSVDKFDAVVAAAAAAVAVFVSGVRRQFYQQGGQQGTFRRV